MLELHLSVQDGNISNLGILGDFLAVTDVAPLEHALLGCPYREDAIAQVFRRFSLEEFLGGITAAEFIATILDKEEAS